MLCQQFNPSDSSGPYSFSGIDTFYYNFPLYSWTVNVFAHEMGHSFGSMHTHSCVWPVTPNRIGAIDSCYASSENIGICFPSNLQEGAWIPRIGTIMSYCHLTAPNGGGVNLLLGFGPMPGDTIRLRYNQAACFGPTINSSEQPTTFVLMQNYPNPYNPGTNIRFDVPKDAFITIKVYDMAGREIANLIDNRFYTPGYFNVSFDSRVNALSSGVYFYKIVAKDAANNSYLYSDIKRMVLLK